MKHSLIVLILCSVPGIAQSRNANAILESCGKAMGAKQQVDFIAEGDLQMATSDSREHIVIKTRGLESFRQERGAADHTDILIISKGRGSHHGEKVRSRMSRQDTAYFKADHLPAFVCAIDPARDGMRVSYIGEGVVGARPVFHLKLDAVPKGRDAHIDAIESLISEVHLFIDQQSFVVLKTAKYVFSPNALENKSLWENVYSDYREVNGVLMPYRLESFVAGQAFSTTTFSSIASVTLTNAEFEEAN
jgi:hypothetical protein